MYKSIYVLPWDLLPLFSTMCPTFPCLTGEYLPLCFFPKFPFYLPELPPILSYIAIGHSLLY